MPICCAVMRLQFILLLLPIFALISREGYVCFCSSLCFDLKERSRRHLPNIAVLLETDLMLTQIVFIFPPTPAVQFEISAFGLLLVMDLLCLDRCGWKGRPRWCSACSRHHHSLLHPLLKHLLLPARRRQKLQICSMETLQELSFVW